MLRAYLLPAGLGAALLCGLATDLDPAAQPAYAQTAWVEQGVQDVVPGQTYRLDSCLTVTEPGLTFVALRVEWHSQTEGYGSAIYRDELPAEPSLTGSEQCLSLTNADAPCAALSARYGVVAKGDAAVGVSRLEFTDRPEVTPTDCPTPTPSPMPTATVTPTPAETPTPSSQPTSTPTPTAASPKTPTPSSTPEPREPAVFPDLVNGGFEDVRDDGTPYGWRKFGGEMVASDDFHAEGSRSAALISRTESTKWLYQAVSVRAGAFYRLRATTLNDDADVRQVWLRVSWYASADASGRQLATADSAPLPTRSARSVPLDTGAVEAPPGSGSAKVRLMVRPGAATSTVYFDDVRFEEVPAPPRESVSPTPSPVTGGASVAGVSGRPGSRASEDARRQAASGLGADQAPVTLVNAGRERPVELSPAPDGRGRSTWAIALALGIPSTALAAIGGHAWWKARLARRNSRHL